MGGEGAPGWLCRGPCTRPSPLSSTPSRHLGLTLVTVPVQLGFHPLSGLGRTWFVFSKDKPAAGDGFANTPKAFSFFFFFFRGEIFLMRCYKITHPLKTSWDVEKSTKKDIHLLCFNTQSECPALGYILEILLDGGGAGILLALFCNLCALNLLSTFPCVTRCSSVQNMVCNNAPRFCPFFSCRILSPWFCSISFYHRYKQHYQLSLLTVL